MATSPFKIALTSWRTFARPTNERTEVRGNGGPDTLEGARIPPIREADFDLGQLEIVHLNKCPCVREIAR